MEEVNLDHPLISQGLRTMRIIVLALILGPLMFTIIVLGLVQSGSGPPPVTGVYLTPIAGVTAILVLPCALWFPGIVTRATRRRILAGTYQVPAQLGRAVDAEAMTDLDESAQLALAYVQPLLLRTALLEGAALFNAVAYLLEQSTLSIGIAATLIVLIATCFPTPGKLADWVATQLRRMHHDAMLRQDR